MKVFAKILVAVLLLGSACFAGVSVYTPTSGSTVGSPVHFVTWAGSVSPITSMTIYADGASIYQKYDWRIDTYIPMSAGAHYVVIQAWDSSGSVFKYPLSITVGGSSTASAPSTSGGTVISNIDQRPGWQACDLCAGGGHTVFGYTQGVNSPSMDGASMQFYVGGSTPYSNAFFWNQLGGNSNATNFVYDLYFYLTDPGSAQSLEFDVNQSVNGYKYQFVIQCNIKDSHTWDVWDGPNSTWHSTGIPCAAPPAYTWNHLTEEFSRANGGVTFVSVTLNGVKHYINWSYPPIRSDAYEINVAFQPDGDYAEHGYSTWLDRISLTYW